jgi:hypothetical protein
MMVWMVEEGHQWMIQLQLLQSSSEDQEWSRMDMTTFQHQSAVTIPKALGTVVSSDSLASDCDGYGAASVADQVVSADSSVLGMSLPEAVRLIPSVHYHSYVPLSAWHSVPSWCV